jgi:hypothetical protein
VLWRRSAIALFPFGQFCTPEYKACGSLLRCALHDLGSGGFGESCILRIGFTGRCGTDCRFGESGLKNVQSDFVGKWTRCLDSHPI